MFPILYEGINVGVVPQNNGLGVLSDAISCNCEEERNGIFEVTFEYPFSGIHAQDISRLRVIKVKPNFTDNPQLFYIDRISKVMNGVFTVFCKHISYLLSGLPITSGTANSAAAACALLQNSAGGYTITTDKTASGSFNITSPSSVRSWFGGKAGSLLDVYGTGEWHYDNFNCNLKLHRGSDRGVTIRYKKNLLELSQEIDTSNLYTHVLCFWQSEDATVIGSKLPTGLTLDVEKTLIIDASGDYEDPPTTQQLTTKTQNYIDNNNLTVPTDNIKLDFVQSGELANRVDLCDTVSIYYEALGITRTQVKCIRTVFDCIREKYIETEFGDPKTNITDTIIQTNNEIAEKPNKSYLAEAVDRATKLITGNLGGYVVIHDSNGDGEPDEILIMNTPDISTATRIWRWNQQGLGYATSYAGPYGLAITSSGEIVADFVTTGSMSANRVRTGLIASTNNQLQIDLDAGTITAPAITLSGQDVGSTLDSLVQTSVETKYALSNSGTVIPSAFPLNAPTTPTDQQPYLWSRTVYTYANGQESTSYGVSVKGAKGADGQDGKSFTVKGTYNTMADLIAAHPTGEEGDAYMVGTPADLVVWDVDTNTWKDVGRIQGPSGFDGLWLAIENDDDGTSMNVTYTVKLLKGVTDVTSTYNAVFVWQLVKESGITEIATGTDSITVARDSADYGATIRCICIAIITEENLEDYSYTVIQDYSGNDIQIIGSNIVKLIGESEIYKPYAISSQFQVLADEISSKVSQTDFNSLSGTVTTQGTQIQQNAQAILLKADTSVVNAQMNGKMGTDMSNRSSSILIDSGQIRFDSNSLVVNSSKFTLDASGNATFAGNITGASLNIGGEFVGIGDAISDAESGAISAAAIDATNKANNAKDSAINTASSDATTKANNAQTNAISTAKDYTDTGLAGKVGNNEIRTKFAADNHSIEIQSGTVKFKSNTLLIDSTQFTLDANGNAIFKGNLSAATLVIGGSTTNIGTAINNAQSNAISTASADATTKADNAKNSAITTAASDATTKANDAYNNSKSYTDTGLAGKVGNSEVRTKFAADTHSVEITSGTIAFKSNTLSIDADNLTVTSAGLVTAKKFKAKDEFLLQDSSGNPKGYFKYPSTGTHFALTNSSSQEVAEIWDNSNSGQMQLKNSSQVSTIRLNGSSGNIITYGGSIGVCNASGNNRVTNWLYENSGMVYVYNANGDRNVMLLGYNGHVSCVQVDQSSSRKVKKNIKPIEDAEKILLLDAVSFDYIDESRGTDQRGFIAEDVSEVLPNLVTPETEETTASLNYIGMIPYLQDIIKKQEKRIQALEEKLNAIMEEKEK
jgi:phage minor structural protein